MIFDFILVKNFNEPLKKKFDSSLLRNEKIPIYASSKLTTFFEAFDNMFFGGMCRKSNDSSVAKINDLIIINVGDVFSRFDSPYFGSGSRILSANEIGAHYIKAGEKIVADIKGNYQLIIIDKKYNTVKVINSKGGVSPFYYYYNNEILILTTAIYLIPYEYKDLLKVATPNILEYAVFNYPLGNNTFFKNLFNLQAGEIVTFFKAGMNKQLYYDVYNELNKNKISEEDAIEKGTVIFKEIVNSYFKRNENYCLSLTGGFDGRAILSTIDIPKENLLLYAFGIKGSKNIDIPSNLSHKMGYNFKPYYLESEYSEKYSFYAKMTCLLTDCLATIQRANYLYVFENLSKHSDTVVTGIFGSELLRTFQNAGLMISESAVSVLRSQNPTDELNRLIDSYKYTEYWGNSVFNNSNKEEVIESFKTKYQNKEYKSLNHFIFTYFIKDALRKYFGGEVHAERIFAANRFPYFDDEFVEYVLSSPFSAINKTFLSPSITERISSQKFYAHILKKYKPELLKFETDHGFAPKYLLSVFPLLFIGPQYLLKNYLPRKRGYIEFNAIEWANKLFQENIQIFDNQTFLNNKVIEQGLRSSVWRDNLSEFNKLFSIQFYINNIL